MHDFIYKRGQLYCEDVPVARLTERYGTPLYVYSARTLLDHYRKIERAFQELSPLICFSVKANSNLAVLRLLVRAGAGCDVVSGGELFRALRAGADPSRIVFASVGKTQTEIARAIRARISLFNVESEPELAAINRIARRMRHRVAVALRINPGVDPRTHRYITTGRPENKFGLHPQEAERLFNHRHSYPGVLMCGVHIHIGSQITDHRPFVEAIRRAVRFIHRLRAAGCAISTLNIGGGLGIIYKDEQPQTAQDFARAVLPILRHEALRLILEPGRFICGNAGILVTRLVYHKKTRAKEFYIVDAGMNDLIRPALYDAYHEIRPVKVSTASRVTRKVDVVGPVCESGDFLALSRRLPSLRTGESLAIFGAGAYGFVMSSNYNSRPRAAEVMVHGHQSALVRRRETEQDLVMCERIPAFLRH